MNIGQVKDKAIKLIAQYSNGGVLVPAGENLDYSNRANIFIDQAQKNVATKAKIHSVVSYSQYPIEPLNGKYYGFKMVQFLPAISGDLVDIQGTNAQSFYFEANANCNCYIEESIDGTVWTSIPSISYISGGTTATANPVLISTDLVYVAVKGIIIPTSITNQVRLRFTGLYPFIVRNRALWNVPFLDASYVPVYNEKLEVEVTTNKWQEFDRVVQRTDDLVYKQMLDFSSIGRKTFIMDYFFTGSFDIHFYKVPDDIIDSTSDLQELEVYAGMAQECIPYYVAGHMVMDEYPTLSLTLLREYFAMFDALKTFEINGSQYITSVNGW